MERKIITGDEPAQPQISTDVEFADANREHQYSHVYSTGGLTIREQFAMAALQGLCANPYHVGLGHRDHAQAAVLRADYLIAQLNEDVI